MFARDSRLAASIALAFLLLIFPAPAGATITVGGNSGEVSPANPSTWTTSTTAEIGINSGKTGTVSVAGGSTLPSSLAYVGLSAGSSGSVVVTGQGSSWTSSGAFYVGYNGAGTLSVENGGAVSSYRAVLGRYAGSSGSAVVTGQGTSWTNSHDLQVGDYGSGTLTVENGGTVTTTTLYASPSDLRGNGTINTNGLIADSDLVFDAAHGTNQVLSFGTGGTLNLSPSSAGVLGVGYRGVGSLRIADGVNISSYYGYLGYNTGSSGSAVVTGQGSSWTNSGILKVAYNCTLTVENGGAVSDSTADLGGSVVVTGQGSSWTNSGVLDVGFGGAGTLRVENGGAVSSSTAYLGDGESGSAVVTGQGSSWTNSGSLYVGYMRTGTLRVENGGTISSTAAYLGEDFRTSGSAVVTGQGSSWTNSGIFYVGYGNTGNGMLTVGNGGKVASAGLSIYSRANINEHVSGNGMIVLGTATSAATVSNNGYVNLYADAFLAAGAYSPITAYPGKTITWSGTGTYNGYGGTWDSAAHTFTVAAAAAAASGASSTLTTGERLLIADSATLKRVGASFGTLAAGTTFQADLLSGDSLSSLAAAIGADQSVLGAWNFTTNFSGDQALLSFEVGAGFDDLTVWKYSGTAWSAVAATDLTYGSDGIANFAVTSFGSYAVTGTPVPEPCSLALLALGGVALLRRRRKA